MSWSDVPVPEQRVVPPLGLKSILRCPLSDEKPAGDLDEAGRPVLASRGTGLAYLMRDGAPILLVHEVSRVSAPDPDPQG